MARLDIIYFLSQGEGEYGQRTVVDQAKEFLMCAIQHPHHFKAPKVRFMMLPMLVVLFFVANYFKYSLY